MRQKPSQTRQTISDREAVRFFAERDSFLVYTHNSPDADTLGSAAALVLGLRQLGKTAYAWNREGIPTNLRFLNEGTPFIESLSSLPSSFSPTLVSVDVASKKMLSEEDRHVFALSVDHHAVCSVECENLWLKDDYPAVGQMIYELLTGLGVHIDQPIASALYAAVSSDSGGFRYESTKPSTMLVAADLMRTGIDCAKINRSLFDCKSMARIRLESAAGLKVELHFGNKFALVCLTEEDLKQSGAAEEDTVGLNDIPRRISGVEFSAVIRPKDGAAKCSFRSNGITDVASLAMSLGGGGHKRASSFVRPGMSVEEMRELVLQAAETCLKETFPS